jgi:hypothetical protein
VIPETAKEVKPGEVAVIVSNTGKDPSDEVRREMAAKVRTRMEREEQNRPAQSAVHLDKAAAEEIKNELMSGDPADRRLDEGAHEAYVVPEGYRGIQETVVGPGSILCQHSGDHAYRDSDYQPDRRMDLR